MKGVHVLDGCTDYIEYPLNTGESTREVQIYYKKETVGVNILKKFFCGLGYDIDDICVPQNQTYHFIECPLPMETNREKSNQSECSFQYNNRFVCFLDILGCKRLVSTSIVSRASYDKLTMIADEFRNLEQKYTSNHWIHNFNFPITHGGFTKDYSVAEDDIEVNLSLFSDSIIISYEPKESNLFLDWYRQMHQIFNDISQLQFDFALMGIFLRGGLSYGLIYHQGNICFGPSLIKAVELESSAVNPCIAVDSAIVEKILSDLKSDMVYDYAPGYKYPHQLKEFAEDLFLSYFNRGDCFGKENVGTEYILDYLASRFLISKSNITLIRKAIQDELGKDYPDKISAKYKWLRDYYNYSIHFNEGNYDQRL